MLNEDPPFVGCMILSSPQATHLPFLTMGSFKSHIEGSVHGSVGQTCSFAPQPFFVPQRGRQFFMSSSRPEDALLLDTSLPGEDPPGVRIAKLLSAPDTDEDLAGQALVERLSTSVDTLLSDGAPRILSVEQRRPYGFVGLSVSNVNLYMYGVYSDRLAALYWTDVEPETFQSKLLTEHGNFYWVHRFLVRTNESFVLNTGRLCSRWYRWSESPNTRDFSRRFQALERLISNGAVKQKCWTTSIRT